MSGSVGDQAIVESVFDSIDLLPFLGDEAASLD